MKSVILWSLTLLLSCSHTLKEKTVKITILHTNDHHGRFLPNNHGEYGLAARATLINQIRHEVKQDGGHVLLLDAGDVNTGVPYSDLLDAEPDFRGMSAIGYDMMAIGNHEFDNSLDVIMKQQKEWAKFPFVSANIYTKNKKRIFPSHITKKIDGLNIIIFGLTTEDTPKKSNPLHTKDLYFKPAAEEAIDLVPKLRPKADVLIAVTHTGHYPNENHGSDAPGDVTIARKAKGIDVIVGGHTQKPLFSPDVQNGTIIVQAYEWGKYVGRIDLEILNKKITLKDYKLIPVNLKNTNQKITPNKKIADLLNPYKIQGDKSLLREIGIANDEFIGRREIVRFQKTNLGKLVATAFKDKFNADLSILNSGGIRDSIYEGKITIETVQTVLPFGGEIVTAELTGEDLKKYLQHVVLHLNPGSGSFPQMSDVKITLDNKSKKIKNLKIDGKEVQNQKKYIMALPEFIARGGDNYPTVKYTKYGYTDSDILTKYIEKIKFLKSEDYLTH